ncbi:hypothetical protein J7L67_07595 [bacterium]|nr:hypothetical protein [bacterium]
MIRHNHLTHNHPYIKKTAHFFVNLFDYINHRKLKHIVFALILLFMALSVIKNIYISLMCSRKVYSYSSSQVKHLKNDIETNEAWILFNKHFPNLINSPALPNYFPNGISYPAFLYTKNIPYENGYMLNLWLFAKVESLKKEVSLKTCILKMIVLKNNTAITSYELSGNQTLNALQQPALEKLKDYLKENVYRP